MDDFKKLDTEGNKALTFRFNKGKVTIWGYYKNFGPVAADMLQLLQRTQPEMYEQQKKLLR